MIATISAVQAFPPRLRPRVSAKGVEATAKQTACKPTWERGGAFDQRAAILREYSGEFT
jgi:hypothetical protein